MVSASTEVRDQTVPYIYIPSQKVTLTNTTHTYKHTNDMCNERPGDSEGREKADVTRVHTLTRRPQLTHCRLLRSSDWPGGRLRGGGGGGGEEERDTRPSCQVRVSDFYRGTLRSGGRNKCHYRRNVSVRVKSQRYVHVVWRWPSVCVFVWVCVTKYKHHITIYILADTHRLL